MNFRSTYHSGMELAEIVAGSVMARQNVGHSIRSVGKILILVIAVTAPGVRNVQAKEAFLSMVDANTLGEVRTYHFQFFRRKSGVLT